MTASPAPTFVRPPSSALLSRLLVSPLLSCLVEICCSSRVGRSSSSPAPRPPCCSCTRRELALATRNPGAQEICGRGPTRAARMEAAVRSAQATRSCRPGALLVRGEMVQCSSSALDQPAGRQCVLVAALTCLPNHLLWSLDCSERASVNTSQALMRWSGQRSNFRFICLTLPFRSLHTSDCNRAFISTLVSSSRFGPHFLLGMLELPSGCTN